MDESLPRHVAFIMDGNGRWAKAQGRSRVVGHRAGAETVRRVATRGRKLGIPYITLYAFSTENWNRPKTEVAALMRLLERFVKAELPVLQENDISLKAIGGLDALSRGLRKSLDNAVAETAANRSMTLTLAINYGGRDEIVRAVRRLFSEMPASGGRPGAIDEAALAGCLDTAALPDPDLVVRTAGEQRLSNFLIWQAAYAEFYFTPVCWPDFSDADFDLALLEYAKRTRKFGGL